MKKRQFIKSSLLGLSASALTLSGCNKNVETNNSSELKITPKQTGTYEFSVPLLFHYPAIDDFAKLNEKYKKSKITTLYNSIPWPQSEKYNEWFMLYRGGGNPDIKTYSDFEKYAKYAMDKGFDVVYLMNSPKAFNDRDIEPFKKDFYELLDNLWNSGIKKIKFANTQVAQLINEYNPKFELSVATIMEYSSISQYRALLQLFPNINHICVPKDQNQNFKLLTALRKTFPKVTIELMIDEGCLKWCPTRFSCMASGLNSYYKLGCPIGQINKSIGRTLNGRINPWDVNYYSAIGINNFKIVPLDIRASDKKAPQVEAYMDAFEQKPDNLKNYSAYLSYSTGKNVNPQDIIHLFPDINYFIAHAHECSVRCGVDCNYCYECAKKLEKALLFS